MFGTSPKVASGSGSGQAPYGGARQGEFAGGVTGTVPTGTAARCRCAAAPRARTSPSPTGETADVRRSETFHLGIAVAMSVTVCAGFTITYFVPRLGAVAILALGCGDSDVDANGAPRVEPQDDPAGGQRTGASACQLRTGEEFAGAAGNPISRAVGAGLDVPELERQPLQGIGRRAWIMHSTATSDVEPGKRLTATELQVCADNGVVTLGLGGAHTPAVMHEAAIALGNQVLVRW
jgi:hypothetical protein